MSKLGADNSTVSMRSRHFAPHYSKFRRTACFSQSSFRLLFGTVNISNSLAQVEFGFVLIIYTFDTNKGSIRMLVT